MFSHHGFGALKNEVIEPLQQPAFRYAVFFKTDTIRVVDITAANICRAKPAVEAEETAGEGFERHIFIQT